MPSPNQTAINIVKDNMYLTLATMDQKPWAAAVFYCVDDKCSFYFISQLESLHTQHIQKNPEVAFTIFDSRQPEGTGNGVQGRGTVQMLQSQAEISDALQWYSTSFVSCSPTDFDGSKPYRLFKLTPQDVYILDPSEGADQRLRVELGEG